MGKAGDRSGQRLAEPADTGLKPAASGGKDVRREIGQDGLLLRYYNYRTSAGFPSPLRPKAGLIPRHSGVTPLKLIFVSVHERKIESHVG